MSKHAHHLSLSSSEGQRHVRQAQYYNAWSMSFRAESRNLCNGYICPVRDLFNVSDRLLTFYRKGLILIEKIPT